jgi:threonine synthase
MLSDRSLHSLTKPITFPKRYLCWLHIQPVYVSTRGWKQDGKGIGFAEAVLMGLAPDGGLLVPTHFPTIPQSTLREWGTKSFQELAFEVMSRFIPTEECSAAELKDIIARSYSTFRDDRVTPVVKSDGGKGPVILELFHGPTFAFKDVALQFLGNMFEHLLSKKPQGENHITVVGATSGACVRDSFCWVVCVCMYVCVYVCYFCVYE